MCGITGQILFNADTVDIDILKKMNTFLKKRGPDAEGYHIENNIGLAHRRLSILDLSNAANQPMEDRHRKCVICFNGEIYNYKFLKNNLEKAGFSFRTNSDTEVILNGYLAWGIPSLLEKLDGMFAFVLVDKEKKFVFACRDRFGKKPLYFFFNNKKFSFSSDIRSLWATEPNLTIDFESVDYFLSELSMPQPKTIWNEIKQVKPAHFIRLDMNNWQKEELCYWMLDFSNKVNLLEHEIENRVEELLKESILKRTIADVPVSAFLSGGVDSGLVVSILASNVNYRVKTYSVGFTFEEYNELANARIVAERYNTDHSEIILESDTLDFLPSLIEEYGEPFADSSNIPSFLITKEISKEYKIALSGDGGDELFGGYDEYSSIYQMEKYLQKYTNPLWREIITIANRLASKLSLTCVNFGHLQTYQKLQNGLKLFRDMGFHPYEKKQLYHKDFQGDCLYSYKYLQNTWDQFKFISPTDTLFAASIQTRLLNDYLVKVDRASMANSLEVRSPFLDHHLAEFASGISNDLKIKYGIQKYLLKKLAAKYIDPAIFTRKKQGFSLPLEHWIRTDFKAYVSEILLSEKFNSRKIFNAQFVEKLLNDHIHSNVNNTHKIWALVCLELWFRKFVDVCV